MIDRLSRRRFLLGGGALGLAACGRSATEEADPPQLVHLFSSDHVIVAGRQQRIPFAVVDSGNLSLPDGVQLPVRVLRDGEVIDELTVTGRIVDHDHVEADPDHQHANLLRYFALRTELPTAGIYDLEVDFGSSGIGRLPIQSFDHFDVPVVLPGDRLPTVVTPTFDDPTGIDPLCTRAPVPCPFHDISLDEVVAAGRPLALLIATPALCQTAYCGPVLETLIAEAPAFPEVTAVHLEFWANGADVDGNYADPSLRLAQPVADLGLTFEPSLFVVDRQGTVVDRIDNLFDTDELRAALAAVA